MRDPIQEGPSYTQVRTSLEAAVQRGRRGYLIQGGLFLVAGVLAVFLPGVTMMAADLVLALLLLISGAYQLFQGSLDRSGWLAISGLLSLAVGVVMLIQPFAGAVALATLIALFLLFEGIIEIVLSLRLRFSSLWGWLMTSGILSLVLGIILLVGWPGQTVFLAGILLGINFILYGAAVLAIVATTKRRVR